MEDTVTDERVGLFTPDKKRGTAGGAGRAANLAARRGTDCGEVGRVLRFPSTHGLAPSPAHAHAHVHVHAHVHIFETLLCIESVHKKIT